MTMILPVNQFKPIRSLPNLRTTGLRTFAKCPHTWALNFLTDDKQRDSVSSTIGTAAHYIIETQLRAIWEHDFIEEEFQDACVKCWGKIPAQEHDALHSYLDVMGELEITKILGIEYEFNLPIEGLGLPVKGTMDLIGELGSDSILIVDHKTNRTLDTIDYWRADLQPLIYAYAARRLFPGKTIIYQLGYVNFPGVNHRWVTDDSQDAFIEAKLKKMWFDMTTYENTNSWPMHICSDCAYCKIKSTCPEHRAANDNLLANINARLSNASTGEKLEYVNNVVKVAEAVKANLELELKAELAQNASGKMIQGGIEYSLTTQNERSLPVVDGLQAIFSELITERESGSSALAKKLPDLITLKIGGLDKIKKTSPRLYLDLNAIIETNQSAPRLKRRPLTPSEIAGGKSDVQIAIESMKIN